MAKILLDFNALSPRKTWSKAEDEYTRTDKEDDSFKFEVASFDKCKETKRVTERLLRHIGSNASTAEQDPELTWFRH